GTTQLGCDYMVVHPIMPFGLHDIDLGKQEETWEMNREFFTRLLKVAHEEDVYIALENMPMPRFTIGSPEQIMDFVKEMNDDHLVICLDTGHVSVYESRQPSEAVRVFGDYLKVTHVHDNDGKGDRHMLPYHGVIDWEDFGRSLREEGYDGVVSIETCPTNRMPEPAYEDMLRACAKMARAIAFGK
nr:sugar phosphate isomerase/epimerase [Clostridia bacterium]